MHNLSDVYGIIPLEDSAGRQGHLDLACYGDNGASLGLLP